MFWMFGCLSCFFKQVCQAKLFGWLCKIWSVIVYVENMLHLQPNITNDVWRFRPKHWLTVLMAYGQSHHFISNVLQRMVSYGTRVENMALFVLKVHYDWPF
jgi:hypothetical protein